MGGFSLIEVVIAVIVLSIGVLGVMSAMTYSVSQQEHAEQVPVAAYYAQQMMEEIKARGLHTTVSPPGAPGAATGVNSATKVAIDAVPFNFLFNRLKDTNGDGVVSALDTTLNLERYQRSVVMTRLTTNSSNYRYNLMLVTITVYWKETTGVDQINAGNTTRRGNQGKASVTRKFVLQAVLD